MTELPLIDRSLPLAGIRVLDLGTTIAAPSSTRILADFGAQVIKVETSHHLDTLRMSTPYAGGRPGPNRSGYYAAYNAGKLSMTLNLKRPAANGILRRLIEVSDVMVEANVPGVIERLGFAWEEVHAINPRIIMASHSLQGRFGPRSAHRGYGQLAGAVTGWYDLTGMEGGEPIGPYSAYTDFIAWPFLAGSVLVALEMREVTGRGQYIDQAQVESSLQFIAPALLDLQLNGHRLTRRANREDYASPNNAYPCAGDDDRWVAITVTTDAHWEAVCEILGSPELAAQQWGTFARRKEREAEMDGLIAAATGTRDAFELAAKLQAAGVPAGVVYRASDLLSDDQLAHRRLFRRVDHEELGNHAVHAQGFSISGVANGPVRAAPMLGEHTHGVCKEVLGLSDDEIAELVADGALE